MTEDDLLLPAEDKCASRYCSLPAAEHVLGDPDSPYHSFVAPPRQPRPEFVVEAFVMTQWQCPHCKADNDVWGVAGGEWMDCSECGKPGYLT